MGARGKTPEVLLLVQCWCNASCVHSEVPDRQASESTARGSVYPPSEVIRAIVLEDSPHLLQGL